METWGLGEGWVAGKRYSVKMLLLITKKARGKILTPRWR